MLRLLAIAAITLAALGCGGTAGEKQITPVGEPVKVGHQKGEVIKLKSGSWLYPKEDRFRKNLEIMQAGSDKIDLFGEGELIQLWKGSEVRVLEPIDGGMKVVVEKAVESIYTPDGFTTKEKPSWVGEVGWIIEPEVESKARRVNIKPIAR
ncbi:hypothetical protein [Singulisphaera sp. PoT]|uniref:hypothetical protein n=1 Tax=Singulisphaera sp. PoT TaxID=3411797 RepID=UPI003BF5BDD8